MSLLADPEQFALEDRMGETMGYVNAATAALVAQIARVLETQAWEVPGVRTPEHFVMWQTGMGRARARRLLAIAARHGELPLCEALFTSGAIGEDSMVLIARGVPAGRDAECAEVAAKMSYDQLATYVRVVRRRPQAKPEQEPCTRFWDDEDGGFVLRAKADHDEGALLKKALEAARDDLFRLRHPDAEDTRVPFGAITWHEAFVWMAEVTLNALDPSVRRGGRASDRHQVLLHLDVRDADRDAIAGLHLGPIIRDSLARYLACDASISAVLWDGDRLLGINPRERTVNDRVRRLIEQRDQGCRVPGCTQTRWLHVHHLERWEDGGATVPCNLCCLCPYHHRLHHAGLLRIEGDPERRDGLKFFDYWGKPIEAPQPKPPDGPFDQPSPTLGIAPPRFVRPLYERVDWRTWWFIDDPPCPN